MTKSPADPLSPEEKEEALQTVKHCERCLSGFKKTDKDAPRPAWGDLCRQCCKEERDAALG